MTDIQEEISLAKLRFIGIRDTQFMFALCCKLKVIIDDSIPTAATDGIRLYINPNFFLSLTDDEKVFLLAHETLHVAYHHVLRGQNYDKTKFNCAADYVINDFLVDKGFTLIKGGLLNPKYKGLSTEEVYQLLPDDMMPNPLDGDILPSDELSDEDLQQIEQNIISAVHHAEMSEKQGSIPDVVKRYIETLRKPKINWKIVLRRFMQSAGKSDYSWKRPNKRLLNQGYYLPSIVSDGLSKVTFAIDVSASINLEMFNQFISEVTAVFKQLNPNEIEVLQFHHEIADTKTVTSLADFKRLEFKETGGTDVAPVIEHFAKTNSKALVVITDGYFSFNFNNPKRPVLWVVFDNSNFKPKFGSTIHFTLGD